MKTFRITYRMEVYIDAETEEQAQEIFDNCNINEEFNPEYVEQVSIDDWGYNLVEGDSVEVPEPDSSDIHNHSFVGTIIAFKGQFSDDKYAVVEDMDGNCFDIELERLTRI